MEPERIVPRHEDYSRWYHDVIRQADLAEQAEVVKGCMVIKPYGYAIWEKIQAVLDSQFKATGHQNAYFPLLIPESFLKREAEHVEGFAPELAVVTHAGGKKLEEPYVIRPTSETIIGHFFGRWIESWRDLPLLINQWANVMRWEMRTRMFLRTSEFLWQEGHTAHATHAEAQEEVRRMLTIYANFCESYMAMPVVQGIKTQTEKFAGALESHCIEVMAQDGRALQAGTSHDLGQNFGRAFNVRFQNQSGGMDYVWQTSWGVSTRLIGALIMTHSDDQGLVLPPKLAPVQVVLIPIYTKHVSEERIRTSCQKLCDDLTAAGISVVFDDRDYKPGYKYFHWEQKGVPVRLELGPRDLEKNQVMLKDRLQQDKITCSLDNIATYIKQYLDNFQQRLLLAAEDRRRAQTVRVDHYDDFKAIFCDNNDSSKFVLAHWDGEAATEARIKAETKATIRCIPNPICDEFYDIGEGRCMITHKSSKQRVLFAKSY